VNQDLYRRGIELFNSGRFYDAHEILEDAWRENDGPEKLFLQGLIQVAVGLHHLSTGNDVGALSLLTRASRNLSQYPEVYCGIELAQFRDEVRDFQAWIAASPIEPAPSVTPPARKPPVLPRIRVQAEVDSQN
jgi:predicted metal-dependent hydrolase